MATVQNRGVFACWALLRSFVSFLCYAGGGSSINVALHAQVPASKEMVVGSTVTMAGVRQALLSRDQSSGNVMSTGGKGGGNSTTEGRRWREENITIFYPFLYDGLHDRSWDLVIIEGWFGMINAFIHEVRAISHPRPVTVLFYCLDPQYPGLPHVAALDVEGFLTNSESTRQYLLPSAPTAFVPLAVDTEAFPFYPDPPCRAPCRGAAAQGDDDDDALARDRNGNGYGYGRVVYVGAAGLMEYKEMLAWMLREAVPYGLDIYGSGWQHFPEFSGYWRGVLPEGDLASVYGTALAVIGVTMDAQRESGKINNRVFEALSVGAPLISDHFPALECTFGDALLYVRRPGDVARHIEALLLSSHSAGPNEAAANARQRRRAMIEAEHTWDQRVEDIISFVGSLPGNSDSTAAPGGEDDVGANGSGGAGVARCSRQAGCLTLAVVVDGDLEGDIPFESTFIPAVDLLGSTYLVTWWAAPTQRGSARDVGGNRDDRATNREEEESKWEARGTIYEQTRYKQLSLDVSDLNGYDVVWAAGRWGGPADRAVRSLIRRGGTTSSPRVTTPRLTAQLTGLVLWGSLCTPSTNANSDGDWGGPKDDILGEEEGCPDYAGDAGLRWYDVVYCQTRWDHAFLMRQAFEGNISDNLQQAWGYGTARSSRSDDVHDDGGQEMSISSTHPLDMLVVGTDAQIPDMLRLFKAPGLTRVALAIVVPPGATGTTTAARPDLASVLAAAGVVAGGEIVDLPQRLALYVVESSEGSSFTPLAAEVLLVRRATDADALAELASRAARVVVVAIGQLGAWATLVTSSGVYDARRRRRQEHVQMIVDTGDNPTNDGDCILALIEERTEGWDAVVYSRRLIAGMTRALCLGRGNSRISLVRPANEGSASVVRAVDTVVAVEVLVEDFQVGRDGQWCITVQGRTVLCVLQNEFAVDLHISSSASRIEWEGVLAEAGLNLGKQGENDWEGNSRHSTEDPKIARQRQGFVRVEVVAELRSNIYQDVLQRSKPFHLFIDPAVGAASAYDIGLGCMHEEGSVVDYNQTTTPVGYCSSSVGRGAFQTSIDTKDFFETSNIVGLGVSCV